MIAIQEQQDLEDMTHSALSQPVMTRLSKQKSQPMEEESTTSPSKINASRSKPNKKKKTIDKEVIKYFKRMIKNQQMDKFKAQMNSQSQQELMEEGLSLIHISEPTRPY